MLDKDFDKGIGKDLGDNASDNFYENGFEGELINVLENDDRLELYNPTKPLPVIKQPYSKKVLEALSDFNVSKFNLTFTAVTH